jgi:hypothetical protein
MLKKQLLIIKMLLILSIQFGIQNSYPLNNGPINLKSKNIQRYIRPNQSETYQYTKSPIFIIQNTLLNKKQIQQENFLNFLINFIKNIIFLQIINYITNLDFTNIDQQNQSIIIILFILLTIIFIIISWKNSGVIFTITYMIFSLYDIIMIINHIQRIRNGENRESSNASLKPINYIFNILIILNCIFFIFQMMKFIVIFVYNIFFTKSIIAIMIIALLIVWVANPNFDLKKVRENLNQLPLFMESAFSWIFSDETKAYLKNFFSNENFSSFNFNISFVQFISKIFNKNNGYVAPQNNL